jgi:hypothetical protein
MNNRSPDPTSKRENAFSLRLPADMRAELDREGKKRGLSLNAEIARRLEISLQNDSQDIEIAGLKAIANALADRFDFATWEDSDGKRGLVLLFYRVAINTVLDDLGIQALNKMPEGNLIQDLARGVAKKVLAEVRSAARKDESRLRPEDVPLAQAGRAWKLETEAVQTWNTNGPLESEQ